jgi:sugar phosphate isomerase/epimerase
MASPIRCECYNSFIRRKDLRVVGDDVNWEALKVYLDHTLARCRELDGSIVVWGSAGSRNVEPGYSRDKAWSQIKDFLARAGEIARRHQMTIAIEPLRHQESNIINSGEEALRLVQEVNHPNIKMIIDYYHLRVENENPDIVWIARKEIVHFHFANPNGRLWPKSPAEDPEYGEFFKLVKKIGFHGGISIEGRGSLAQDATAGRDPARFVSLDFTPHRAYDFFIRKGSFVGLPGACAPGGKHGSSEDRARPSCQG